MKSRSFVHHAETRADLDTVADLVDDVDGWSAWTRPLLAQTKWTRWGNPAPGGRGAVRRLGLWPVYICELITSYERGHYQEYAVVSPQLFNSYSGRISLSSRSDGATQITWSVEFVPRFAATGPIAAFALSRAIGRLSRNLARAADAKRLTKATV
jgi:Polyketide cyclase / dehydrase and lipid transport